MEVRPGYKQTGLGIIPVNWGESSLLDLAERSKEQFDDGDWVEAEYLTSAGVRLVQTGNIGIGEFVEKESKKYISPESFAKLRCKDLYVGDILICRLAEPAGRACILPDIGEGRVITAVDVTIFRPPAHVADRQFLVNVFSTPQWFREVSDRCGGSTRTRISRSELGKIVVQLPSLPEQRAIATALSDVDALLGGLDRLIAKKCDLKQAAMQQLLTGHTRLPGFYEEWEVKRLNELAHIRSGGTPSTSVPHFWDGDIPWCTPTDITALEGHKYLVETARRITVQGLKSSSAEMIPTHSVVMTSRATIGECAINSVPVSTNQGFKNFVLYTSTDVEFLFYLLQTQKQGFIRLCGGSTFLEIGKTQLADYQVRLPATKAEQTAIAAVLSDMDAELSALDTRRDKTRALKQGMMQELLTGKTRLVASSSNVVSVDPGATPKPASHRQSSSKPHNWQINEAVVVAVLVKRFGSAQYPLGRKRCTKLAYLMHRHVEHQAEGYLKKAAGPYNPAVKYKGPEGIAQKNGYIRPHINGRFTGFVAAQKIAQAESYFNNWYGRDVLDWLEQFRRQTNDELEVLATVDMAIEDLKGANVGVNVKVIKSVIREHPEWQAKLERSAFADQRIAAAIDECQQLFPS